MAMQLTMLAGYPDRVGKRFTWAGFGKGPASYATGGDPIALPGFGQYIDAISAGVSVSGTYFVMGVPSVGGPRPTWRLMWFLTSTGAQVTSTTDLSGETVQFGGLGGMY
jgi:hypothetical protein